MVRTTVNMLVIIAVSSLFFSLFTAFRPDEKLNDLAAYYAQHTVADTGAANIVTAIVVTYRGLDTLGEVTVLFLSASVVGFMLRRRAGVKHVPAAPNSELFKTAASILAPMILLLGAYIFVNGHLTPGGGFQGGAVVASAALLFFLASPEGHIPHFVINTIESLSGIFYVGVGALGLYFAAGFLDNRILPLGELGTLASAGAIPVIYTLIGMKVGAELSSILVNLRETGGEE